MSGLKFDYVDTCQGNERQIPAKEPLLMEEITSKDTKSASRTQGLVGNGSKEGYNASHSLEQVKLYLQILHSYRLVM